MPLTSSLKKEREKEREKQIRVKLKPANEAGCSPLWGVLQIQILDFKNPERN